MPEQNRLRKTGFITGFLKYTILLFLLCAVQILRAQDARPSPEVRQMYNHAIDYVSEGNLKDAAITFRQAIVLDPGNVLLYTGLGNVLYLEGNYKEAEETLSPLISKTGTNEAFFRILALCQSGLGKPKEAKKTLELGINHYPSSGLLYYESGKMFLVATKKKEALNNFLTGIFRDPDFPDNYYSAFLLYSETEQIFPGLLYGEIFLNIPHDTTLDDTLKAMMLTGWKKMFDKFGVLNLPDFGKSPMADSPDNFEAAAKQILIKLTPVISDGVTTENLVMVRTRFIMEWFGKYGAKYPFSLFTWQDELIRNGKFEIYNEWLFGKAENVAQFNAWNNFHNGDIKRMLSWKTEHPLKPVSSDFYKEENMEGLFGKKKR
jgi:tetratricopeptide (TPR) repeat protein